MQRLGAIAKSPGVMSLALGMGSMIAMHGLQQGGLAGGAQSVGGAALAGIGAASMFPALGLTYLGEACWAPASDSLLQASCVAAKSARP